MRIVYLLRSIRFPDRRYTGVTSNLRSRVTTHNEGRSFHTAKFRPWRIVAAFAFADEARADEFEQYLKTGSGAEFARRHFW